MIVPTHAASDAYENQNILQRQCMEQIRIATLASIILTGRVSLDDKPSLDSSIWFLGACLSQLDKFKNGFSMGNLVVNICQSVCPNRACGHRFDGVR